MTLTTARITTMDTTKEILNSYGYEEWLNQELDSEYKVSKEKIKKSAKAIYEKRASDLIRDNLAYESMIANKPEKPPRKNVQNESN